MIDDEKIEQYLGILFGQSEPGAMLHQLLTVSVAKEDFNAIGVPDPTKMKTALAALAAIDAVGSAAEANQLIAQTIARIGIQAQQKRETIYLAALTMEVHDADVTGKDEVTENLARRLQADGKLQEHPDAVEATILYAVDRLGRRWHGKHHLTGPNAGTIDGPHMIVGMIGKWDRHPYGKLLRKLVGHVV